MIINYSILITVIEMPLKSAYIQWIKEKNYFYSYGNRGRILNPSNWDVFIVPLLPPWSNPWWCGLDMKPRLYSMSLCLWKAVSCEAQLQERSQTWGFWANGLDDYLGSLLHIFMENGLAENIFKTHTTRVIQNPEILHWLYMVFEVPFKYSNYKCDFNVN